MNENVTNHLSEDAQEPVEANEAILAANATEERLGETGKPNPHFTAVTNDDAEKEERGTNHVIEIPSVRSPMEGAGHKVKRTEDGAQIRQLESKPPLILIPGGKDGTQDQQAWPILGLQDAFKDAEMPPWAIQDLVMAGTVTLVSAHPHAMKSLSWLYACLEAVVKKKVFAHFAAPTLKNVLFIETEDPEWLVKKRIQGFAKGLGLKEDSRIPGFRFTCPGPFDLTNEVKKLESLIKEHNLDLIVLSTLQNTLEGRDWKEQRQMADVMSKLVKTARLCPIVVLTHSPQDQRQKRAAGTITIGANCATHIHYEKAVDHKAGKSFVNLSVDSKAGAAETQFALELLRDPKDGDPVSGVRGLVYAGKGKKGKHNAKNIILAALKENPNATTEELAELADCTERHVQNIRKGLEDEKQKG